MALIADPSAFYRRAPRGMMMMYDEGCYLISWLLNSIMLVWSAPKLLTGFLAIFAGMRYKKEKEKSHVRVYFWTGDVCRFSFWFHADVREQKSGAFWRKTTWTQSCRFLEVWSQKREKIWPGPWFRSWGSLFAVQPADTPTGWRPHIMMRCLKHH